MADDGSAVSRAWLDYANWQATVAEQSAFCAGFRAGLAHARQWRPLTDDPKSWPEEGHLWPGELARIRGEGDSGG